MLFIELCLTIRTGACGSFGRALTIHFFLLLRCLFGGSSSKNNNEAICSQKAIVCGFIKNTVLNWLQSLPFLLQINHLTFEPTKCRPLQHMRSTKKDLHIVSIIDDNTHKFLYVQCTTSLLYIINDNANCM